MAAAISKRQDSFQHDAVIFKRHFSDVIASYYFFLTTYLWTAFYILEGRARSRLSGARIA
jgi:hypothetical protein